MRVCARTLRRLAGSRERETLASALADWTRKEIDSAIDESGRTPLMMAAWRGNIENVRLLLDAGCDIDRIATGKYSYGKSAIFFAITQCRDDVVDLCIERGAKLTIVNNKGQSPRSLAVSHLSPETLSRLIANEQGDWTDYRKSHSDGFVYGDLDRRFVDGEVCWIPVRDVCLNPTTAASRKGNFERNNPQVKRNIRRDTRETFFEAGEIEAMGEPEHLTRLLSERFADSKSWNWMPDAALTLHKLVPKSTLLNRLRALRGPKRRVERALIKQTLIESRQADSEPKNIENTTTSLPPPPPPPLTLSDDLSDHIRMLGPCPRNEDGVAILNDPPRWISSSQDLPRALPSVVFFDAEFDNLGKLATLQLAWILDEPNSSTPTSVVIDAPALDSNFVAALLNTKHLVGFAIKQDLRALRAASSSSDRILSDDIPEQQPQAAAASPSRSSLNITDLQALAVRHRIHNSTKHSVPALAALVRKCLGLTLEKKNQRADWGNLPRPLAPCYMNYAALDAAILPFLLKSYLAA